MKKRHLTSDSLIRLRNTAVEAAHEAGNVLMRKFRKKLKISEKPKAGIVTDADLEAEDHALSILQRAYPEFGILAEESDPKKASSPGCWILDPLDGTTNFAHGFPMFSVSIAAQWNNELILGVIFHPVFNETYTAIRGKGAFLNRTPIQVSSTNRINRALLSTGFSSDKDKWLKTELLAFEQLNRSVHAVRRPGSAALDLAYVARGVFDGFWERGLSAWDIAAGAVLVQEAGGKISDFNGTPKFDFLNPTEVFCSNGILHKALLRELYFKNNPRNLRNTKSSRSKTTFKSRPSGLYLENEKRL